MSATRIRPIRDLVLVERDPAPVQSAGGIWFPEASSAAPSVPWRATTGTAIAVGPKVKGVQAGDRLALPELGGVEIRHEGILLSFFPEAEIIGVLPQAGRES